MALGVIKKRLALLSEGFFMGGFIPTCHTQAYAEMTKVEKCYEFKM